MSGQRTFVTKLDAARGRALGDALTAADFAFRPLAHARFQARGEGVVVSLYESGKLVVQGRGVDGFLARFLPEADGPGATDGGSAGGGGADGAAARKADAALPQGVDALGSDEAGKGDTFGGMAVCAVCVPAARLEEVGETGVADSKSLTPARVRALAPWLREHCAHAERVLDPAAYNARRAKAGGNVNRLLTALHAEVLEELAGETGVTVAVVDRFDRGAPVTGRLRRARPGLEVHEVPRAERHPAVAAASVLARERFVTQLEALAEEWAVDLPLGSGAPVPPALRRFVEIHGAGKLGEVAKLHFRNVREWAEHG